MTRIFITLACLAIAMLFGNMYLGLTGGDYNATTQQLRASRTALDAAQRSREADREVEIAAKQSAFDAAWAAFQPIRWRATIHIWGGVLTALVTVFVNSVSVTYFIGTSRWCREVVEAYDLDPELEQRANRLKRRSFPASVCGMLTIVGIVALGAASDPGTLRATTGDWVVYHLGAALVGTSLIAACLFVQYNSITQNQRLIETIVGHVQRVRQARGLDASPAAVTADSSAS